MEKKMSIIDDIRTRYENRNKERLDAEGEREERRSEKKNHGNTKLPYGIAKGKGIDTTGLSPKEVWEKLIGEGVSPKKEYEKLSKASSGKVSSKVKPGSSTMTALSESAISLFMGRFFPGMTLLKYGTLGQGKSKLWMEEDVILVKIIGVDVLQFQSLISERSNEICLN